MNIVKFLRKSEIYFILALFFLNVYCAFALKGENVVNSTHLMMALYYASICQRQIT